RNIISGNGDTGVIMTDETGGTGLNLPSNNVVEGNYIGTDVTGTVSLGNGTGVALGGVGTNAGVENNMIGGTAAGAGNVISNNSGDGVVVNGPTGNAILGNSIHDNGGVGIHLFNGGNHNQAFPVFTSATSSGGATTLSGTLQSLASTAFRIECFANTTADPSGYGQGLTFLGFTTVTTNGSGAGNFTFTLTTPLPAGPT